MAVVVIAYYDETLSLRKKWTRLADAATRRERLSVSPTFRPACPAYLLHSCKNYDDCFAFEYSCCIDCLAYLDEPSCVGKHFWLFKVNLI